MAYGKIGKKSDDGDELKRLKEIKKSYANYLKGGGNKITAPKVKSTNTIQSLIVKKPSPKRPGGR